MGITAKGKKNAGLLTEGSIAKGILSFAIPLFLGQLLQQFYNEAALLFQNILVHVMKKAWKLPFIQTFYLDLSHQPFLQL